MVASHHDNEQAHQHTPNLHKKMPSIIPRHIHHGQVSIIFNFGCLQQRVDGFSRLQVPSCMEHWGEGGREGWNVPKTMEVPSNPLGMEHFRRSCEGRRCFLSSSSTLLKSWCEVRGVFRVIDDDLGFLRMGSS